MWGKGTYRRPCFAALLGLGSAQFYQRRKQCRGHGFLVQRGPQQWAGQTALCVLFPAEHTHGLWSRDSAMCNRDSKFFASGATLIMQASSVADRVKNNVEEGVALGPRHWRLQRAKPPPACSQLSPLVACLLYRRCFSTKCDLFSWIVARQGSKM